MHSASPLLPVLFKGAAQLPEMLGVAVAQGMDAVKAKIGLPVVMTEYTVTRRQDVRLLHGIKAALFMDRKIGTL